MTPRARSLVRLAIVLAYASSGCRSDRAEAPARSGVEPAWLGGSVAIEGPGHSRLVVLLAQSGGDAAVGPRIVEHFAREGAGDWGCAVPPGTYSVAAFRDADGDGAYGDGEAFLAPSRDGHVVLAPGERRSDLELLIPAGGRPDEALDRLVRDLRARTPAEQAARTLAQCTQAGRLTTLHDPRFDTSTGRSGLWRPVEFTLHRSPGIWFLERCDPGRIPVLLVHGITGHPREFETIVGRLDRERLQPWVLFYPSGLGLATLGDWLADQLERLAAEHGVRELGIVAHSMGGLVARAAVLELETRGRGPRVSVFVSLSTPFGGIESAGWSAAPLPGHDAMPAAFRDLAVGSAFLDRLYFEGSGAVRVRRRLSAGVSFHLLYGTGEGGWASEGDGRLPLATMRHPEALEEARSVQALAATHVGILHDPDTQAVLAEVLADLAR